MYKEVYSQSEEPKVISEPLKKAVASELRSCLMNNAAEYGLMSGILAKSGTAEIGGKKTQAYLVSANTDYTVVVSTDKTGFMGVNLTNYVNEIYGML